MGLAACLGNGLPRLLCACRLQRKGTATRQSQAYPASAGGPFPHVSPRRHHATGRILRRWRAGVRGRIDPRIGIGAGAPACLRHQACSCPCHSDVLSHAWCQACVELASSGGWAPCKVESSRLLGIMPWRSSSACHRMCCGPDTFLWFIVLMQLQMIRLNDHRNRGSAQDAPRPCLHRGRPSRGNQPET